MSIISYSYVPDQGWTGKGFCVSADKAPENVSLVVSARDGSVSQIKINSLSFKDGQTKIQTEDFDYRSRWTLSIDGTLYTRKDMTEESCEGVDAFDIKKDGNVIYRL